LENGIVVYYLEDNQLALININVLINTGSMYDPARKEGVAELTLYLMKIGGTKKLSSDDVDQKFDFLAASPSVSTGIDSAQVSLSILDKDIDQSLDLLAQIMIEPTFEQNKIDLAKGLKLEELRRLKDDPQKLAFRQFNRLIYGTNPRSKIVTIKSVNNIKRNDLLEFHKNFFQPHNTMFAVTGNISKKDAISKIKRYFGNWNSEGSFLRIPVPPKISPTGLFYINKEISQSTLILGLMAPGKKDPDYYAFTILDFIIGSGGFSSRIFDAVRNNEGLAYSAGSFYRARPDHGIFTAYAFTKTETTFKTFSLINSILSNTQSTNMITANETNWAKKSIKNSFVFSFTSPEQIAWQQMKIDFDGLPNDFLATYLHKIEDVKIGDINKTALRYLYDKNRIVLILGNVNKFDSPQIPSTGTEHPIFLTPED